MNASERLALSRERMRQAMRQPDPGRQHADQVDSVNAGPDWLLTLRATPAARLLVSVFEGWWARQPLRVALSLAAETGTVMLQPTAQKHPFKLVLGAAVAGGLLAAVRPWRWIPTSALLGGLVPQLMSEALKHRGGPPQPRR
jgi:hypothetical protein